MLTLTLETRKKHRSAIKQLERLQEVIEVCLNTGQGLPDTVRLLVGQMAQTDDLGNQYTMISTLLEDMQADYRSKLRDNAAASLSCFAEYMNMGEPPAPLHELLCAKLEDIAARRIMRAIFSMPPGHAKAVGLNVPIPTPYGWRTVNDLRIGDEVFDENGIVCHVIRKTPVFKNRPVFNVLTDCGDVILSDDDHNWMVRLCGKREIYKVKTTRYLYDRQQGASARAIAQKTQGKRASKRPMIKHGKALQLPNVDLSIDPYVLGFWLGDGNSDAPVFTIGEEDEGYVTGEFLRRGYVLNALSHRLMYSLIGIRHHFSALGVLNHKHIPMLYLRSSINQRMALLQGLVDSDGHVHPDGQTMITSKWKHLAEECQELVRSLGVKCSIIERPTGYTTPEGKKIECGPCWSVSFYMKDCALLPRKRSLTRNNERTPNTYIDIEPAGIADTMCIEVDSPSHLFLVGRSMTPTHNSTYGSHLFPAWYLGNHGNHKYIQAGHSQDFVENEFGKRVRAIIDSEEYKEIPEFSQIRLSTQSKAAGAFQLAGRLGRYLTRGVGQGISGYRANIAGVDDPYASRKDAESAIIRKDIQDWLMADFTTRLLPRSPIFIIATRWHPSDICGYLEEKSKAEGGIKWDITNLPAICEEEEGDPLGRLRGDALWPEFYNIEHLEELKSQLPPRDWNSLYQGKPVDEHGGAVKAEWFQRYTKLPSRELDTPFTNNSTNQTNITIPRVKRCVVSVDSAAKDTQRNDFTVITVWLEDQNGNHYLALVKRERLQFEAMCSAVNSTALYWHADAILMEDKGSGTQYIQVWQGKVPGGIPVIPIGVNNNSKQFRFDGVTPMFEAGHVWLPQSAVWLADYERELLQFPGSAYDDQVDSTSQYLAWVRKGRQLGTKKVTIGTKQASESDGTLKSMEGVNINAMKMGVATRMMKGRFPLLAEGRASPKIAG